jgi:hypothetical protein
MQLGPTVRAAVEFVSMSPRNAIRASAQPVTVNRTVTSKQTTPPQPHKAAGLQIKLQAIIAAILTTLRPFPDALSALREQFRQIQGLEIVE